MGSEMCIRDRLFSIADHALKATGMAIDIRISKEMGFAHVDLSKILSIV